MGLIHCFINKDKNIKNHIAPNMESIAYIASEIHNEDVVISKGDKDLGFIIMNKTNYIK